MSNERIQFLVEFAYNGADFFGVQEQANLKTVLGALRSRIEHASLQRARCLFAAARTDRGVHALHNCATFYVYDPLDKKEFIRLVETVRPDGLLAVTIQHVENKTHARAGYGKIYRYTILDDRDDSLLLTHPFASSIAPKLNLDAMINAAKHLIGEMDFSSLRGGDCQAGTVVKKIYDIKIFRADPETIIIEIAGQSFLRKMIRNMVGLLVEIGVGLRTPSCIPS